MNSRTLLALVLLLAGCSARTVTHVDFTAHNASGAITVAARNADQLAAARDLVVGGANRILFALDGTNPRSDLARINNIAASSRWPIPTDLYRVLDLAHYYSAQTDGALDMALAPVADLWGLGQPEPPPEAPAQDIIDATLGSAGEKNVIVSDDGTIAFYSPITRIDMGNLAVGYALDVTTVNLRRRGITNVLVRLKQSVRAAGMPSPGIHWTADLPDPWNETNRWAQIDLPSGSAMAVARLYEDSVTIANEKFGHILDPRTGRPAKGTAMSVVVGPSATMANALAQALVVLGSENAPKVLARFPRCEALLIPDQQPYDLRATAKMKDWIKAQPAGVAWQILERPELPPETNAVTSAEEPAGI